MSQKWFENWFNSPYYHLLYQNRNNTEAELFINNLCNFLTIPADAQLLDIACGRGRHAIFLNKKGYDITGIDLSFANIRYAKQFENEKLHFFVHDMRNLFYIHYFDVVFNLFTSFGYFDTELEHINALKTFQKSLKKDGLLVLDYFNSKKIVMNLSHQEIKQVNNIEFRINKEVVGDKIVKSIRFNDQQQEHFYTEEVKAFSFDDFKRLFALSGFEIVHYFGDYFLNEFNETNSDRLILICRKTNA